MKYISHEFVESDGFIYAFTDQHVIDYVNAGGVIDDSIFNVNAGVIVVDKASFKIALARLGLLDTVLALVAGADTELQILFNDKTEFHSNNKVLNDFAQQNSMSAQLQEVFAVAQQVMREL